MIDGIANQLRETGVFQDKYALHVRPIGEGVFQILQGHHRVEAARRAGIETIPCWSEELNDEDAYMQLILGNQQDGMSPLEIGIHALGATEKYGRNGKGVKAYAESIGKDTSRVSRSIHAATVFLATKDVCDDANFLDKTDHLATIHKSPSSTWPALVSSLIQNGWSVKETEKQVTFLNTIIDSIPSWYPIELPEIANIALTDEKLAKQIQSAMKEVVGIGFHDPGHRSQRPVVSTLKNGANKRVADLSTTLKFYQQPLSVFHNQPNPSRCRTGAQKLRFERRDGQERCWGRWRRIRVVRG